MVQEEEATPSLCLTGLPQTINKNTLRTFFDEHGKVLEVIFKYGADSKRVKGVAYVLFESQETVDKLIEKKHVTIEETKVEMKRVTGENRLKGEEPLLAVPKEALKCDVCKRDKFPSLEAFINHKKGKQHLALLKLYKAKSASVLQLLRAEAKLASDRSYDVTWLKKHPDFKKPQCDICQLQINCNPMRHNASIEHKMVKNFIQQKCCDISFTSRGQYDAHLLTLKHLKNVYTKDQKSGVGKDSERLTMKRAIDIYKQCDTDLKELKETYGTLDLNDELPEYDKTPIGLNYIVKKINYYCICCDQRFFANMQLVEPHCRSFNHYSHMVDYISEIEKTLPPKRRRGDPDTSPNKKVAIETADIKIKKKEDSVPGKAVKKTKPVIVKASIKEEKSAKGTDGDEEDVEMANEEEAEMEEEEEGDHEDDQEEDMDHEEEVEHEEEENQDEEDLEDMHQESQEEVGMDSDVQEEEEAEVEDQQEAKEEEEEEKEPVEEKTEETPVAEDVKDDKEEEEEVAVIEPKPTRATRGRRGRGRGGRLKR